MCTTSHDPCKGRTTNGPQKLQHGTHEELRDLEEDRTRDGTMLLGN